MQGIRAKVTDRVPWNMLGLGAGGIWLAVMFQSAETQPGPATTTPTADPEPAAEDATVKLRRLAQLRDSGVITEAEFQGKNDLLAQIQHARFGNDTG